MRSTHLVDEVGKEEGDPEGRRLAVVVLDPSVVDVHQQPAGVGRII